MRRMPGRTPNRNAGHHLDIALQQFKSACLESGIEVVRQVTRLDALVLPVRVLPLTLLNEVPRTWEGQPHLALRIDKRVATGMIEVEVGIDHDGDILRLEPERCQRI